ncbi:DNA adenine methylase [Pandoraea pulmonicola]|uniref:Site-specific DNA-methyltransferase (adenine-specific) n=1 Tax=Pandoraea pulmonicola TaxID=93221 RepID=A0AAJ4Z8Z1_PANPU|nr:Modification methylase DpnIIA [Pandoraea pulmonicola]
MLVHFTYGGRKTYWIGCARNLPLQEIHSPQCSGRGLISSTKNIGKGNRVLAHELSRSPIRWAGSKRKLLLQLQELAPTAFDRYVEPFCGSLCLFVALKPKNALVGDINSELIHFYRIISWRPRVVAELAHALPIDSATYYRLRSIAPNTLSAEQRAARFLYLNRFCFNGVYRTNRAGYFNVSRGRHTGSIPNIEELLAFGRLIRNAEFHCSDFENIVANAGEGDFVYLDPPYAGRDVRDRGEYGPGAFKMSDMQRLFSAVQMASNRGAKILISYADLPIVRDLFCKWNLTRVEVARNVSGFTAGRTSVSEIILRNYKSK